MSAKSPKMMSCKDQYALETRLAPSLRSVPLFSLPIYDPQNMASTAPMPTEATTAHASSKVSAVKNNLKFLVNPTSGPKPSSLVTRSSLQSLRYVLKFAFWRMIRYCEFGREMTSRGRYRAVETCKS